MQDNGARHEAHNILKLVVAVEFYLLVDNVALDEVLFEYGGCPLAETCALYRLHTVANRDDDIKVVQCNFFYLRKTTSTSVILGVCIFCTYQAFVQFTFLKNIRYMAINCCSVFSKQLCHLTLCQSHCLIFQIYIKLYASVLRVVYFD